MANCKYQKIQYKYSNDNGQTWHNVVPEQIKAGDLIEYDSPDCSSIDAIYKWEELDGQYICVDNVKFKKEIRYESYDAGATWYVSYPAVYRAGERVGVDEDFCNDKFEGHYAPVPTDCPIWYKWNGYACVFVDPIKIVKCDGNPYLTSADTAYYSDKYYLVSGKIGECITDIDDRAFQNCTSLSSLTIPSSVASIGSYAFSQCTSLPSITIPDSVTIIEHDAFEGCISLSSLAIPNSVTSIGQNAFYRCSGLTSVTIGNSVTDISCFYRCSGLTSVTIPDSVTSIGRNAFTECTSLSSITIPNSVTSIGYYAFSGCSSLTNITIPDSVTSISESAFEKCRSLSSVTIPDSVTSIGSYAFQYCYGLSYIINLSTTPQSLGFNPFGSTNDCPIYVPASAVDTFKNASGWKNYADRIQAIT